MDGFIPDRGKYRRLFITKDAYAGIHHGNGCLRDSVQTEPSGDFTPYMVGINGAREIKGKPSWIFFTQQQLGAAGQPVSPQTVPVIGCEQLFLFQGGYDRRLITFAARQPG